MKPVSLYLKNFKSYGQNVPVLNFAMFDVALLTGENGNGKSSIADAIAWCLWGRCKGMDGRSGIDDLVHVGTDEMEVVFTFEEEDNVYRIVRKRDRRKAQSFLDLMVRRENGFVSVGGDRIDETQEKIRKLVKLDYETYLCTAYLSQGKSDLFAVKKPRDRKEILGEILGLRIYEKLERRAADIRNELENKLRIFSRELEELQLKVVQRKEVEKEYKEVLEELQTLYRTDREASENLGTMYNQRREKELIGQRVQHYKDDIEKLNKEISDLKAESQQCQQRITEYQEILGKVDEIEAGYQRYKDLQKEEHELRAKLTTVTEYQRQKERIEGELKDLKRDLEHQAKALEEQKNYLYGRLKDIDEIEQEYKSTIVAIAQLDEKTKNSEYLKQTFNDNKKRVVEIKALKNRLDQRRRDLQQSLDHLATPGTGCPFCRRLLDDGLREKLTGEVRKQIRTLEEDIKKVTGDAGKYEDTLNQLDGQLQEASRFMREKEALQSKLDFLKRHLNQRDEISDKLLKLDQQLEVIYKSINGGERIRILTEQIDKLTREIENINYNEDYHHKIQVEIKKLDKIPSQREELERAKARSAFERDSLERINRLIKVREEQTRRAQAQINDLEDKLQGLPNILVEIERLEKQLQECQKRIRELEARRGGLEERKTVISKAAQQLRIKEKEKGEVARQLEVYKRLVRIYGKQGIQAVIIENSIPELQHETNRILSEITNGRLTVEFLTLRNTKEGNTIETLDIRVFDGIDARKYETYSGGEEFRINFAIRIALAKILAYRAGANLRMLILDEGFGVLDEEGRERLVEVINAIRKEFDKILVITHVQDLKSAFPTHIEVYRIREGSTFRIVG